jgi:hypothetical protein
MVMVGVSIAAFLILSTMLVLLDLLFS